MVSFVLALKLAALDKMTFKINRISTNLSPHTITVGLINICDFNRDLFPYFQTDLVFKDIVESPVVDMKVDIELDDGLLTIRTNGKRVGFKVVEKNTKSHVQFLRIMGSMLKLGYIYIIGKVLMSRAQKYLN